MAIPVSNIVNVEISREDLFQGVEGFGTVNIIGQNSNLALGERLRHYETIEEVGSVYSTQQEEYIAAQAFFSQSPRAKKLIISRRALISSSAELYGLTTVSSALANFAGVSDGEFKATIDGVAIDITGVDTTGDATLTAVAATIEAKLNAEASPGFANAVVKYNAAGYANKFIVVSGTVGDTSTIAQLTQVDTPAGTDISGDLFLHLFDGIAYQGYTYLALTDELNRISAVNDDWYWATFTQELRENALVLEAAAHFSTKEKIYVTVSNNEAVLTEVVTTDIISQLQQTGSFRVVSNYSSVKAEYSDVAIAAVMGSVDFDGTNTTITAAYKDLIGITPEKINSGDLAVIQKKSGNLFTIIGSKRSYFEGRVANFEYIDTINNTDWIAYSMRLNVFNVISNSKKVPFTDTGIAAVNNAMRLTLSQAVTNGILGIDLDENNKPIKAYTTAVPRARDISAANKSARNLPGCRFTGHYAGAIHFVRDIVGTLTVQ